MSQRRLKRRKPKYYSAKRRAVYAQGDDIDPVILFQMHGWICYVCKQRINPRLRMPNYLAATIEHIVPICKGGTHTWDNTAPAHAKCNFSKSDSLPLELGVA